MDYGNKKQGDTRARDNTGTDEKSEDRKRHEYNNPWEDRVSENRKIINTIGDKKDDDATQHQILKPSIKEGNSSDATPQRNRCRPVSNARSCLHLDISGQVQRRTWGQCIKPRERVPAHMSTGWRRSVAAAHPPLGFGHRFPGTKTVPPPSQSGPGDWQLQREHRRGVLWEAGKEVSKGSRHESRPNLSATGLS